MAYRSTPWGQADSAEPRGKMGIFFYSTPSHGGFYVPEPMLRDIPVEWRNASFNGQGKSGWFEEDCDWCMVALTFPALFESGELEAAQATFDHWIAPKLKAQ